MRLHGTLVKAALENLSADPSSGNITGQVYWSTTGAKARIYNGSAWQDLGPVVTFDGLAPTTTKGDLIAYSGSTNVRIPVGSDGQVPVADSSAANGLAWKTLQQGAKNYITYNNFENNATTGWSLSHTTLSSLVPNQASASWTSASGSLAISSVSSGAIGGGFSLKQAWTGTTSVPGDMLVSQAYTIDLEDQAKILAFKFFYSATVGASLLNFSGTSANTYQVWIYDVTNSAWIQPAGAYNLVQSSGVGIAQGTFQTPSNMTQFRIALVCINASTTGSHTILLDDFYVGPQSLAFGPAMTDWQSYTPTTQGLGTPTGVNLQWRRVGSDVEIRGYLTTGTTTAVEARVGLPPGLTSADTSSIPAITAVGQAFPAFSSATVFDYSVLIEPSVTYVTFGTQSSTANATAKDTASHAFGAGPILIMVRARVPVQGWSSNTAMSADTDTRVCSFTAHGATATLTATASLVSWTTIDKDTHAGFNGTTTWTCQVSGEHRISASLRQSATYAAGNGASIRINKNGTEVANNVQFAGGASGNLMPAVTHKLSLVAGDQITITADNAGTSPTVAASTTSNVFSIERLSGPAVVAATESVNCQYNTSTQTVGTALSVFAPSNKVYDTHNLYSAGVYTVAVPGKYRVGIMLVGAATSASAANANPFSPVLQKGGVTVANMGDMVFQVTGVSMNPIWGSSAEINCVAGDQLQVQIQRSSTITSFALTATATNNWITFERIGN